MLELLLDSNGWSSTPPGEYVLKQTAASQSISWVIPDGVTSICVVCVGHGSFGGGGLSWRNDIPVIPGDTLEINFSVTTTSSQNAGSSKLLYGDTVLCIAYSGGYPQPPPSSGNGGLGGKTANPINDGGGNGGQGSSRSNGGRICGGAGGYLGGGGNGTHRADTDTAGVEGSGSGSGGRSLITTSTFTGGNVGLYGIGITGANVATNTSVNGNDGSPAEVMCGAGVNDLTANFNGGIRIIWGEGYSYPSNAIIT